MTDAVKKEASAWAGSSASTAFSAQLVPMRFEGNKTEAKLQCALLEEEGLKILAKLHVEGKFGQLETYFPDTEITPDQLLAKDIYRDGTVLSLIKAPALELSYKPLAVTGTFGFIDQGRDATSNGLCSLGLKEACGWLRTPYAFWSERPLGHIFRGSNLGANLEVKSSLAGKEFPFRLIAGLTNARNNAGVAGVDVAFNDDQEAYEAKAILPFGFKKDEEGKDLDPFWQGASWVIGAGIGTKQENFSAAGDFAMTVVDEPEDKPNRNMILLTAGLETKLGFSLAADFVKAWISDKPEMTTTSYRGFVSYQVIPEFVLFVGGMHITRPEEKTGEAPPVDVFVDGVPALGEQPGQTVVQGEGEPQKIVEDHTNTTWTAGLKIPLQLSDAWSLELSAAVHSVNDSYLPEAFPGLDIRSELKYRLP